MKNLRLLCLAIVGVSIVLGGGVASSVSTPARAEEDSLSEKLLAFDAALKAARGAEQGDRDARRALTDAMEEFEHRVDDLRKEYAADRGAAEKRHWRFVATWNEAVTVLRFHDDSSYDYVLKLIRAQRGGFGVGVPAGGSWTYDYTGESQHVVSLFQRPGAEDTPVCEVKIWRYRWDTVYSGVGGENYKKLADDFLELDQAQVRKKGRKASRRVRSKRLNKEFSRSQYYFVEGHDVELDKRIRRHNYYVKDVNTTYCIEVIEYLDAETGDDRIKEWLRGEDCPERAALLESATSETD